MEGGGSRGKVSEETKQRNREAAVGRTNSKESNQKRSEAMRSVNNPNYGKTGEKSLNSKRVYQYDLDGTFIESFGSVAEAGRYLEKDASSIQRCARKVKGYKTAYNFKWSYDKLQQNIF